MLNFKQPFLIAEIEETKRAALNMQKLLIDAANNGADAVKFQTYFPDRIVSKLRILVISISKIFITY